MILLLLVNWSLRHASWAVRLPSVLVTRRLPQICFDLTSDKIVNCWKSIIREVKQAAKSMTGTFHRRLRTLRWSENAYVLEIYKLTLIRLFFLRVGFPGGDKVTSNLSQSCIAPFQNWGKICFRFLLNVNKKHNATKPNNLDFCTVFQISN